MTTLKIEDSNRSAIARATGVSLAQISRIFSGRRRPSFDLAGKIARHLGITLDEFQKLIQN